MAQQLPSEALSFDADSQAAYQYTKDCLERIPLTTLSEAAIPSLVALPQEGAATTTTTATPSSAEALQRKLQGMDESMEQQESGLMYMSPLTVPLTQIATAQGCENPQQALQVLQASASYLPRRVCQKQFKKNDIIWFCRTCQADETCAQCHECFQQSDHEGHDVAFFHNPEDGGCCDCGDPDAWDVKGFCPRHGPQKNDDMTTCIPVTQRRKVCQRPFEKNDMIWMCRTCQADRTCAMCHECFSQSDHEGHDVTFFPATKAEGCCDCGDPEAWNPKGFCPHHGCSSSSGSSQTIGNEEQNIADMLPPGMVSRVRGLVTAAMDWMVQHVAESFARAFQQDLASTQNFATTTTTQSSPLLLILHIDDVHTAQQWSEMVRYLLRRTSSRQHYYPDPVITQILQSLEKYGQLVIAGADTTTATTTTTTSGAPTSHQQSTEEELSSEASPSATAPNSLSSSVLINMASTLRDEGHSCRLATLTDIQIEQRALGLLQWLSALAFTCDPLCQVVAESILPHRHLVPLLERDFMLSTRIKKVWYSLLLTLLATPTFKANIGVAYATTYQRLTSYYALGGSHEKSAYTLSVQYLNQDKYVIHLVQQVDWIGVLGKTLLETLQKAVVVPAETTRNSQNHILDPNHVVMTFRRYQPCILDLTYAIQVQGLRRFMLRTTKDSTFLQDLLQCLVLGQGMDSQAWRHWDLGHVEHENLGWYGAFNFVIVMAGMLEQLMMWQDSDACANVMTTTKTTTTNNHDNNNSMLLPTCLDLTYTVLTTAIQSWQQDQMEKARPSIFSTDIEGHRLRSRTLPFSTLAAQHGCTTALSRLPISQSTPFSLHIPLHRFLAACLRELCLRPTSDGGVQDLLNRCSRGPHPNDLNQTTSEKILFRGVLEFPALVMSRAAQVQAGLWRRNGPALHDQVAKYSGTAFCRTMRDADLILLQFASLGGNDHNSDAISTEHSANGGICYLIHLLVHLFGLFDFCGLAMAPKEKMDQYQKELEQKMFPPEIGEDDGNVVLPWTYTPARDASDCRALLEEFLHLMIIFAVELPAPPPVNDQDSIKQAKMRLRQQVVHRLAAGPKTHSELEDVYACMSLRDKLSLKEEGKSINPDDASQAMMDVVLEDIAERKSSRSRLEPDRFELKKAAWESYDPCFFHVSVESHQTAAERRPHSGTDNSNKGKKTAEIPSKPFAPAPNPAHPSFERLRRDLSSDATLLAIIYRILHMHCRESSSSKSTEDLKLGSHAYDSEARSEIAFARAIHLLTVGAFAWETTTDHSTTDWRKRGGGSPGSIFFGQEKEPTVQDWIAHSFLADPDVLLACEWYRSEENMLKLLSRVARDGGTTSTFTVQDPSVQAGAAWLCEFAAKHSPKAAETLGTHKAAVSQPDDGENKSASPENESEFERRKRLAKERAMAKMNSHATKFASAMKTELDEFGGVSDGKSVSPHKAESEFERKKRLAKERALAKIKTQASNFASAMGIELDSKQTSADETKAADKPQESDFEKRKRLAKEKALAKIKNQASKFATSMGLDDGAPKSETELEKRKRLAKEKAMARMNAQAAKFASMMASELGDEDGDKSETGGVKNLIIKSHAARRLLKETPQCIICSETDAECFVALLQGSTVLVGGGNPYPVDESSSHQASPHHFVGTHIAMCGHAVHEKCFQSYFAKVQEEEETKSDMFRCPLCQRPSNGLVPFVNVGLDWINDASKYACTSASENADSNVPSLGTRESTSLLNSTSSRWNMSIPTDVNDGMDEQGAHVSTPKLKQDEEIKEEAGNEGIVTRFLEKVVSVGYEADRNRLGLDQLEKTFGEFRHYMVENQVYKRVDEQDRHDSEWPGCMFTESLNEAKHEEFGKEKLLSKLFCSIQAFVYSCCCEAAEARCMLHEEQNNPTSESAIRSIYSKFGLDGVVYDGDLLLTTKPDPHVDGGVQPFYGRFGRLRYLGLSTIAQSGVFATELVQLGVSVLKRDSSDKSNESASEKQRAPIANPILLGNVLTHVVASIFASLGISGKFASSSKESLWMTARNEKSRVWDTDLVLDECLGFVRLGILARTLQVLLHTFITTQGEFTLHDLRHMVEKLQQQRQQQEEQTGWEQFCWILLEHAVSSSQQQEETSSSKEALLENAALEGWWRDATLMSAVAVQSYLADVAIILQVLLPGFSSSLCLDDCIVSGHNTAATPTTSILESCVDKDSSIHKLEVLRKVLRLEAFEDFFSTYSGLSEMVRHWVEDSLEQLSAASGQTVEAPYNQLFQHEGYHGVDDWPISARWTTGQGQLSSNNNNSGATKLSNKRTAPLLGGGCNDDHRHGCVKELTWSYMDLYVLAQRVRPEAERTALCLICGKVLDAGGKGECTEHSNRCGAGTGIFFLLQDCEGLILHRNGFGSYIRSIYVDSHGGTPRGRPLYLDEARYHNLRSLWLGHGVRQQILTEREATQQGVVGGFY